MKSSVERLRWGLAGAAVLLLVVLGVFLGYGRYRAQKIWRSIAARSGVHITHETDGFTYSQTLKGRTVFTLHAAKAVQHGDGKWTLHDVVVTLYSKTSPDVDHVYCSDVEYDENTGVATALGEVDMDLQVPGALAASGHKPAEDHKAAAEGDHVIHVRTSGLVYLHKLGVAATSQQVEFRYAGMQCVARGAEFDSGESLLHLLADVVVTGNVRHAPMTVHAVRADLNRTDNTITMVRPVGESQGRTAAAANAVLHLRNDGSLEQAEGSGGVTLDAGTRHIAAAGFEGSFGSTSLPLTTQFTGGVVVTDSNSARPLHAQAGEMDTSFNELGNPVSVSASGAAQVAYSDRKPGSPDLAREMRGDRIVGTFVPVVLTTAKAPGGHKAVSRLSEIHATGSAMARGDSVTVASGTHVAEIKSTRMFADDLRAVFDAGAAQGSQLRQIFGNGSTRLQQDAPLGEQQTSSGDKLEVEFASEPTAKAGAGIEIASATQTGHVAIHSVVASRPGAAAPQPSDAGAARAVYDGATAKLTLSGAAHYTQGETTLTAATIGVDQHTGDAEAEGSVLATLSGAQSAQSASSTSTSMRTATAPAAMTHVSAERAHLAHASQLAEFLGSEAHPARLWQGASQVQAASLLFDQKLRSLAARPATGGGLVHAVFANSSGSSDSADTSKPRGGGQVVRVASAAMDYSDVEHEATFSGGVHLDGTDGQAHSQRGVVFLNPAEPKTAAGQATPSGANPFGGSVRRIVLTGDVRIEQPGRTGNGEQLVYTAADSSYILTGTPSKPPHVVDAEQGSVTGATLLFHSGNKSVVVSGASGSATQSGRVRTETEVKQP